MVEEVEDGIKKVRAISEIQTTRDITSAGEGRSD
jgi:hypothetical protein